MSHDGSWGDVRSVRVRKEAGEEQGARERGHVRLNEHTVLKGTRVCVLIHSSLD